MNRYRAFSEAWLSTANWPSYAPMIELVCDGIGYAEPEMRVFDHWRDCLFISEQILNEATDD